MNETEIQIDRMITQRAALMGGRAGAEFQAAMWLLQELGPVTEDENDAKREARAYLTVLVDRLPAS